MLNIACVLLKKQTAFYLRVLDTLDTLETKWVIIPNRKVSKESDYKPLVSTIKSEYRLFKSFHS